MIRRRRGAPAIELYKACSGANDGPWRQSGVLQEPRVQLLRGLDAPIDESTSMPTRAKVSVFHSLWVGKAGGELLRSKLNRYVVVRNGAVGCFRSGYNGVAQLYER